MSDLTALRCESCGAQLPESLVCLYCRTRHVSKVITNQQIMGFDPTNGYREQFFTTSYYSAYDNVCSVSTNGTNSITLRR